MSKTTVGAASIAVTLLLTVASTIAPGIPDEHRMKAFIGTLILLALACLWWLWARFFSGASPKTTAAQEAVSATNVSGNVAAAGRDVHQTIYQHPPTPPMQEVRDQLPDFFYHGAGSQVVVRPVIPPGKNYSVALVQFRLQFVNGGQATAYNLAAETYGCWINEEKPTATLIDSAKSVGRTPLQQGKSLEFHAEREWDNRSGLHNMNVHKNILTILVEITFRVGSSDGPIHMNEPIWLTWTPAVRDRMTEATEADVLIAAPLIERLKAGNTNGGGQLSATRNEVQSKPPKPIEIRDLIDRLIGEGRLLTSQWETQMTDDLTQKRRADSVSWLSRAFATVKEHLTMQQFDKLESRLGGMTEDDRISLALHIIHAGTKTDSDDYELALKVADKVAVLRQLRTEITQLS